MKIKYKKNRDCRNSSQTFSAVDVMQARIKIASQKKRAVPSAHRIGCFDLEKSAMKIGRTTAMTIMDSTVAVVVVNTPDNWHRVTANTVPSIEQRIRNRASRVTFIVYLGLQVMQIAEEQGRPRKDLVAVLRKEFCFRHDLDRSIAL